MAGSSAGNLPGPARELARELVGELAREHARENAREKAREKAGVCPGACEGLPGLAKDNYFLRTSFEDSVFDEASGWHGLCRPALLGSLQNVSGTVLCVSMPSASKSNTNR